MRGSWVELRDAGWVSVFYKDGDDENKQIQFIWFFLRCTEASLQSGCELTAFHYCSCVRERKFSFNMDKKQEMPRYEFTHIGFASRLTNVLKYI